MVEVPKKWSQNTICFLNWSWYSCYDFITAPRTNQCFVILTASIFQPLEEKRTIELFIFFAALTVSHFPMPSALMITFKSAKQTTPHTFIPPIFAVWLKCRRFIHECTVLQLTKPLPRCTYLLMFSFKERT